MNDDASETDSFTAVRLIAQRELNTRLRTRSFVLGTLLIIAVLGGYVLLQAALIGDSERRSIGLSGQANNVAGPLTSAAAELGLQVETHTVAGLEQARAQVASGELDAVVSGNAAELQVMVRSDLDPELRAVLTGISRQEVLAAALAESGVEDPAAVLAEANSTQVKVMPLAAADPEKDQRLAIGLMMLVLLFFAVSTYGAYVAQGVIEEKTSRVVEILLAAVRPWQLLLGKVIGLGLVGLVQMVIIAGAGLALASAVGVLTLSGVALGTLAWGVLWYVIGWMLYAALFAGAASLVSRQEDMQGVVLPVTVTLTVGFVVGLNLLIQDPEGGATAALSLVPVLSPILMPGRIAAGGVAAWEIVLALLLTVGTVALVTWLGGKVYSNAVLRTGSRVRLLDALRGRA